jgi:hypothetical protein
MLLLLLLAKGWAVTRLELTWKPLVFTIWFIYGVVHILLYVWNMVSEKKSIISAGIYFIIIISIFFPD